MARYQWRITKPYWLIIVRVGQCAKCQIKLPLKSRVWYYPLDKVMYCETCGEPMAREFQAAVDDERNNTSM